MKFKIIILTCVYLLALFNISIIVQAIKTTNKLEIKTTISKIKTSHLSHFLFTNSTNSTTPAAKKCGRSVGNIPQTQEWISNPSLDFLTDEEITKHTKNEPCKLFSGIVYMVEKAKSYETNIQLVKVFVTADTSKITFSQALEPNSKFHEISMEDFIKVGQRFLGSTCFDVVSSSKPNPTNPLDIKNKRGSMTLCTLNVKQEQVWVKGLIDMKSCVSGTKHNLVADFSSINRSIQSLKE